MRRYFLGSAFHWRDRSEGDGWARIEVNTSIGVRSPART